MKKTKLTALFLAAICAGGVGSEAFARGGGKGQGSQMRDGSGGKTHAASQSGTMSRQHLQDGTGAATGTRRQGQGQMKRLGPGDGTGNTVPPANGTGYGSTTNQ